MIVFFQGEEWRELTFKNKYTVKYALSNYGRVVSYSQNIKEGRLIKPTVVKGFLVFKRYLKVNGKRIVDSFFIHKKVAELFLPAKTDDQTFVLHLNFVKNDNRLSNLRWANKEEMEAHQALLSAAGNSIISIGHRPMGISLPRKK
jgi:hypothetical protein